MASSSYSLNSSISYGSDYGFDPFSFSHNLGIHGFNRIGSSGLVHSLVLDGEKGELVKAPIRIGKKGVSEAKALAALKSHSEAERRRRERINAHLATLRGLVPSTEKMDKATLLREVISRVKELKKLATEASKGSLIPTDSDEVRVEQYNDESSDGSYSLKASLCCSYRPELLSELRQALDSLNLKTVRGEISTLEDRVKNVFVFTICNEDNSGDGEARRNAASSIHRALSSVLDKVSASEEYSPRTTFSNKRRRVSFLDSSSSSSWGNS